MEGKKNLYIKEVVDIKDDGTGEIIESKRQEISQFEKEPPYVKIYLEDIGKLNGLNNSEQKLLNELVHNMGYGNIIPSYKPVKEMMSKKLDMPYNTLDKAIKELHKKGVLIRKARGLYVMDPNLFGRGTWSDIKKIRMVINYNEDGTKSINTDISKQLGIWE